MNKYLVKLRVNHAVEVQANDEDDAKRRATQVAKAPTRYAYQGWQRVTVLSVEEVTG